MEVQLQNQVGAGKMGSVYKAEWKGWTVAVKKTVCTATEAVRVDWAGGVGCSNLQNLHEHAGWVAPACDQCHLEAALKVCNPQFTALPLGA